MAENREVVVVDASALVDLVTGTREAVAVSARLRDTVLHAPAHMDAEVLSATGRMYRGGELSAPDVDAALTRLTRTPITRHLVADLVTGAWSRRDDLRLVDALYVELAARLNAPLLTMDHKLARTWPTAEALGK